MNFGKVTNILIILVVIFFSYKFYMENISDNPEFDLAKVKIITNNGDVDISVKVASTVAEKAKGLMYIKELPKNEGMLFIYDQSQVVKMWMKNTFIPLDMIFVDENYKIKHIAKNAIPHSLNQISSIVPIKYVIEVNAGFTSENNIDISNKIEIEAD